jgi:radical SAM protein with 4Fe4S-binding SPASM domain
MAYKTGITRDSVNPFPLCLEDWISADNEVRVIDAFVDWLDLKALGFHHTTDNLRGTSVYPPSMLLKLYLYGYLNRIRSSRRLELECTRNIELHWLLHQMTPKYHTIADFRKDHVSVLKSVFKEFTQFCIALSLVEGETVAIDGTKMRAQNNTKNNFNAARLKKLLDRISLKSHEYEQYLAELDEQDKKESPVIATLIKGKTREDIEKSLAILEKRRTTYTDFQTQLAALAAEGCSTEQLQISTVDPDARSLPFKQNTTEVGYNIQTVGDAKHSLIIHYEVTNIGDNNALSALTAATKDVLNLKEKQGYKALADAGYHTGQQLKDAADQNVITYVSPLEPKTVKDENELKFTKDRFIYDPQNDVYTCPNQQKLTTNGTWYEHNAIRIGQAPKKYKQYTLSSKTCKECPFAEKCQGNRAKQWHGKSIERTEFDDAVEANLKRITENKATYQQRKEIIEHPFGTIKRSYGYTYTLLKTKKKVAGEFALIYLCYNIRRVINILGTIGLKQALNNTIKVINTLSKHQEPIFLRMLSKIMQKRTLYSPKNQRKNDQIMCGKITKNLFCTA